MGESPWRWRPEARLSGYAPETAEFLERAIGLGAAVFPEGGPPHAPITLAAIAQRGAATVSVGGASAPVVTTGAPAALTWPGPDPERGFQIAFADGDRAGADGPWGMLRFLDGLRLRQREEGRRFLLDVRLAASRAYLQMDFEGPVNPVSLRPLLRGLTCPDAL
jgi:type VI protein secretion system component VasK